MTPQHTIRPVELQDLPRIRDIYNHYVRSSVVTFEEHEWDVTMWQTRMEQLAELSLPFLVMTDEAGTAQGYALVQPWSAKSAYRFTVEHSIYLAPEAAGHGLGGVLLEALAEASSARGLRQLVAVIADGGAESSIRLHKRHGFTEVGHLSSVGYKFGAWHGIVHLQRELPGIP